jgi:hypothetical protein
MSDLTTWSVAAETKEVVGPISVAADGVAVTTFEVTLTDGTARPATWVTPTTIGSMKGILIGNSTFPLVKDRKYTVWVRFTSSPEVPVQRIGYVKTY